MPRTIISSPDIPPSRSPLSPAVAVGELIFVSGHTASGIDGIKRQTRAVLEKLGTILRAAGSDYARVIRCGVYLKDMSDFEGMNRVYREFFAVEPPARSTIGCALAASDLLVEIDCVAEKALR